VIITHLLEPLRDAAWNLEDFVAQVNRLLPTVLSSQYDDARQREDFSVRLLRHYTSLGLLDEAAKLGREARYGYRHLLQVLCLRQLQRQGWNSKAIAVFCQNDNAQLEAFLQPETDLLESPSAAKAELQREESPVSSVSKKRAALPTAPPQSSALEFLQQLRSRKAPPAPAPAAPMPNSRRWKRLEIVPGLELHLLENLHLSATERQRAQQVIEATLQQETER
jgi:DNA-binding transcriptional MerR regulator